MFFFYWVSDPHYVNSLRRGEMEYKNVWNATRNADISWVTCNEVPNAVIEKKRLHTFLKFLPHTEQKLNLNLKVLKACPNANQSEKSPKFVEEAIRRSTAAALIYGQQLSAVSANIMQSSADVSTTASFPLPFYTTLAGSRPSRRRLWCMVHTYSTPCDFDIWENAPDYIWKIFMPFMVHYHSFDTDSCALVQWGKNRWTLCES